MCMLFVWNCADFCKYFQLDDFCDFDNCSTLYLEGPTRGTNKRDQPEGPTRGTNQRDKPEGPIRGTNQRGQPEGPTRGTNQRDQPEGPTRGTK